MMRRDSNSALVGVKIPNSRAPTTVPCRFVSGPPVACLSHHNVFPKSIKVSTSSFFTHKRGLGGEGYGYINFGCLMCFLTSSR